VILDAKGQKLGEYWNSGYFSDYDFIDLNKDGRKEIIISGLNNEYKKGCILVFEPSFIGGCSPQQVNEFKQSESKPGSEKYYILLPKTDVSLAEASYESVREINHMKNSRIAFWTHISGIEFEFNYGLEILDIRKSHTLERKHRKYLSEGKINSELNEEYLHNLEDSILYWDGQNWVSTPTMTAYWKNKTSGN
jgi:hypothetical protein